MLFSSIYTAFADLNYVRSIWIMNAEQNIALNRAEFLILINFPKDETMESIITIHKIMRTIQRRYNILSNNLILTTDEFMTLLKSEEANPLREMLPNRINIISPQAFWAEFVIASEQGLRVKFETKATEPAEIREELLTYNLLAVRLQGNWY